MSIGSSGGTAVKSAALVAAPLVWRCLLAVATVRCIGSLLCCPTVRYQVLYALGIYYIFLVGAVFFCNRLSLPGVWFIMCVINRVFLFRCPPSMPPTDAAYSIIMIIDQVQVLCCETAHGVYLTKREKQ